MARTQGFNRAAVKGFFGILETEFEKYNYTANRIFNVDETGLSAVQSKIPKVISLKGKRQIGLISSADRGSLVSVIACINVAGTSLH
jgi:hypothetical protein